MMKKIYLSIFSFLLVFTFASEQLTGAPDNKSDVWDFGAVQLDTAIYINKLDSAIINSWYALAIVPGSANNVLPSTFTAGILTWVGGSNDRLRTTNTKLTRYDANIASAVGYTGRIYVNSAAATGRYISLVLGEDNEVSIVARTDAGGNINFQYVANPAAQTNVVSVNDLDTFNFVAQAAGTYRIFDTKGKPSYFRIYRKDASYVTIKGTVDVTQAAGIPAGYGINMKNSAGKTWNSVVEGDTFSIKVPAGYTYSLSISGANGYIINNGNSLDVTEATTTYNVAIEKIELYNVTGSITGLDSAKIANFTLAYTSDPAANKIYIPTPITDAGAATYTVQLEANCKYFISAQGINDYFISNDTIIGKADTTVALVFAAKPVYDVSINATGLSAEQLDKLILTFANLNEPGYTYTFDTIGGISLRDGIYSIAYSGLDEYPVQLGLTSNLKVEGAATAKTLIFSPVTIWSFDDKAISTGATAYKGLLFTGLVNSELAKGHLTPKPGATIKVPLGAGSRMKVTYYYTAAFKINNGDTIKTATNSTSIFEYTEHQYTGNLAGFDTIKVLAGAATTYITEISIYDTLAYEPVIYVGADKDYKTINSALTAISKMMRSNTDRVTVMIDPGNYEEMLVVNSENVTLKNAAASPGISLANKGADIDANAVRITSYYGHGYNYYSMGTNQKWDSEILRVNKENGSLSYENKGSGTTNGSFWNATVVINANGFESEDIIFENSFNQYISRKEAEDVVVMWAVGNKGLRPVDIGNTNVQKRSFVERAAAIAITDKTDKVVLTKCRVVGRQDAFYGGTGTRVVVDKGVVMGAVDYIFGGMTAVFYKTDLVMNTSDESVDAAYLTAAQQSSGRGYLMYKCAIRSAIPGTESASAMLSKPGYFGRPWQPTTSEVVFYNTTIDTSGYTGRVGNSLIEPAGWDKSLGGESNKMYEYGTMEKSGENNSSGRVSWSTVLSTDTLTDGTAITTFNFTKGTDNWDPLPVETDVLTVSENALTIAAPVNSTKTFDIASNVSWTVFGNQNWLTISDVSGFDSATVTLTATENLSVAERIATVTVTGSGVAVETITVTQAGAQPVLTVSSSSLTIAAPANSTNTFDITSNTNWTVASNQGWLSVSSGSGSGNSTLTLTAEENAAGSARTATVTVSATGVTSKTITVTQDAGVSGINEELISTLYVFPNPASEILNINGIPAGTENIFILDAKGQIVLEQYVNAESISINVSSLSSGLYMIMMNENAYKLIIE